ncbi:MAG: hypothetical protein V1779_16255 [bacterium]
MGINKNRVINYLPDRIMSIGIIFIYIFLTIFGLYSLTNPQWLIDTSYTNKKEEVSSLVYQGVELSKKNFEREAIEKFDEALAMIPDFAEAMINKGVSYKRLRMYDLAIAEFERALSFSFFDSSNIYSNMKDIYLEINDTIKAEHYFNKAFETSHSTVDKYMKRGIHYYNMKNLDSSLASYQKALFYRQKMITYYKDILSKEHRKSKTKYQLRITNEKEVLRPYDSVCFKMNLDMDRGLAENYNKIGFIIALQGDYSKALEYFYKAVNIWKGYRDANSNIMYIYEKMNKK